MPYFLAIGQQLLRYYELTPFSFKWWLFAILGFKKFEILTAGPVQRVSMHQRAKFCVDCLNRCGDMAFFAFSRWRPSAILDLFYVYLDHVRRVFVGLCHCGKFDWNWCSNFDNMPVLTFNEFGLKVPIRSPFWVVFGDLTP